MTSHRRTWRSMLYGMSTQQRCAVLIASKDRGPRVLCHALWSVRNQTYHPDLLVLVNDGKPLSAAEEAQLHDAIGRVPLVIVSNRRTAGVAGAWNTGLDLLRTRGPGANSYVAILDDDDLWDPRHLEVNLTTATRAVAGAVVSGLRMIRDGETVDRPLPNAFGVDDFLAGNPGWQGSNTFVSLELMFKVGGFRDGMLSLNDRDLAIRILRAPGVRVGYTNEWTSSWHLSRNGQQLSSPRSKPKLSGLRWFWRIYGREMSPAIEAVFFTRAASLFGIGREAIIEESDDHPPHTEPRGDLCGRADQ